MLVGHSQSPGGPRVLSPSDYEIAYAAWKRARRDIWADWQRFTDPTNLMPKVERVFREMAEHVRRFPADLTQVEQSRLVATLEAPWDVRTRRAFQEFFDPDAVDPNEITTKIQRTVRDRGMTPFQVPRPWPPIEEDEVQLVCWMAVKNRG